MKNQPRGIITVLNTPFTGSDHIDVPALQRNVRRAINAGVAGFLVPAMASEVGELTSAEKVNIVDTVVNESQGSCCVIGGVAAPTRAERLAISRTLLNLGCDGILVPLDHRASYHDLESELLELSEGNPGILMVQDWAPDRYGLSLDNVLRLFDSVSHFNWLKIEVADAGHKYTQVLQATNGKLNVAGGWAVTRMMDGLERGVHAFMPTAMHSIYTEIYQRYSNGDREAAATLFHQIQPVLAFSNQNLPLSIQFFKRLLHRQDIYNTDRVRINGEPLSADQQSLADELIRKVITIEQGLNG